MLQRLVGRAGDLGGLASSGICDCFGQVVKLLGAQLTKAGWNAGSELGLQRL